MRSLCLLIVLASWSACALTGDGTEEGAEKRNLPQILSSVDLRFWGRVVMNVHSDTDDIRGNTDFATYIIGEGNEEVSFNGRDTRFGFSASSKTGAWDTGLVAEIDFYGDNAGNNLIPRLRLGYVKAANSNGLELRMGQDWIPIGQMSPGTVDFGILAWGGNLWWRVPQITVRQKNGNWEWLGSLMKHRISTSQENQEDMPWAIGRAQWSAGDNLVAFGLAARTVEVEGNDYDPYLGVLELKFGLGGGASIVSELWTGAGVGREFIRYGLDYNHPGATEIEGRGGFVSLSLKTGNSSSVNLGVGLDDPEDEDTYTPATTTPVGSVPFLENRVMFGNYKWKFNKQLGGGLEVMHIDTEQISGESISGQRFTVSCGYVF